MEILEIFTNIYLLSKRDGGFMYINLRYTIYVLLKNFLRSSYTRLI